MNMFIAFISYSYTEGVNVNDRVQESLEEELKKRHWTVILREKRNHYKKLAKKYILCWCNKEKA